MNQLPDGDTMAELDHKRLSENLDQLEREPESLSVAEAELLILGTLTPLLQAEGFSVRSTAQGRDTGVDYIGSKPGTSQSKDVLIGIEYKHYIKNPVGAPVVRSALGASVVNRFDRMLLITGSRFTSEAKALARRELPVALELLDVPALRSWLSRVGERSPQRSRVIEAITDLSRKLARYIAEDPQSLWEVEWRDLERVLAEVFKGVGFDVELTPGSKDKGKDIVLQCRVNGEQQTYIVEVKHWRSGKTVGKKYVTDFVNVVASEERHGGLFVSSSGYANAVETLTEVERQQVRLAGEEKIISLCQNYHKLGSGIWSAPAALPEVLFTETL